MKRIAAIVALLCAALLVASPAPAAADALRTRHFEVEFKPLAEAAELISPLLSDEGSLILRPKLDTLIVEDRPDVLRRIVDVLEGFDVPPKAVQITFVLFLGRDIRGEPAPPASSASVFSEEVHSVIQALGDVTKWTSYEPLGSRAVRGQEGASTEAQISDDYRVAFRINTVARRGGTDLVKFDRIVLQRVGADKEGQPTYDDVYATAGTLKTGMLHVAGAATGPDADRALFLTMQVEAE